MLMLHRAMLRTEQTWQEWSLSVGEVFTIVFMYGAR
jgi:hypothetical protein